MYSHSRNNFDSFRFCGAGLFPFFMQPLFPAHILQRFSLYFSLYRKNARGKAGIFILMQIMGHLYSGFAASFAALLRTQASSRKSAAEAPATASRYTPNSKAVSRRVRASKSKCSTRRRIIT